jgi:hypothetical protein
MNMRNGGNERARLFFRKHGFDSSTSVDKSMLNVKYESRPAQLYRKELADLAEGANKESESFLASFKQVVEGDGAAAPKQEVKIEPEHLRAEMKQSAGPKVMCKKTATSILFLNL